MGCRGARRAGPSPSGRDVGMAASWNTTSIPRRRGGPRPGRRKSLHELHVAGTTPRWARLPSRVVQHAEPVSGVDEASAMAPMNPAPPVTSTFIARASPPDHIYKKVLAERAVSRILSPRRPFPASRRGDDHSSSPTVTRGVQRPTRGLRPGQPRTPPYLVLLRVGFSLPALSPGRRCALTAPFHPCHPRSAFRRAGSSAVCFLWHFPWGRPRWPLTSTLPSESGLSSPA